MTSSSHMLVAGCSHTAGVGVDINRSWANVLSRQLDLDLVNLARGSACARYVADTLIDYLAQASTQPDLVVVQWPNPYRSMKMINQLREPGQRRSCSSTTTIGSRNQSTPRRKRARANLAFRFGGHGQHASF
jgi:hypothetical protein